MKSKAVIFFATKNIKGKLSIVTKSNKPKKRTKKKTKKQNPVNPKPYQKQKFANQAPS